MTQPTGRKLLETFIECGLPTIVPPPTNEHKIRMPVCPAHNPRKDVTPPANMASLPLDERGYLVPWFVAWIDGKPDFRCIKPGAIRRCIRENLCWLCGWPHERDPDGSYPQTYVIGPMCSVNRISGEPGSHFECARYAVRVCPFLTAPQMRRNEKGIPEDTSELGGLNIKRNPGVSLLWTTSEYRLIPAGNTDLFYLGSPTQLECWREGRFATRAELTESIHSGLPILQTEADAEGPEARAALARMVIAANDLIDRFL